MPTRIRRVGAFNFLHFLGLLATFIKSAGSCFIWFWCKRWIAAVFYAFGIVLVVVGVLIIVAAIVLASIGTAKKSKVRGAGVIMIGPVPIIFGTDKQSVKTVLTLALALTIVVLIIVVLNWFLR